ncbi:MAG TPA: helix-turn-helix transcriptional regulator [Microscillaceae bacterium]|nr:helix-turn-helix transcriptional regulator [Microscillaceae bacterium]
MHKYTNDKEILEALERQALLIQQKFSNDTASLDRLNNELPHKSSVSKHDLVNFNHVYISEKAVGILEIPKEKMISEPIHSVNKILFPGDFQRSVDWIQRHLSSNKNEHPTSYIQRMKLKGSNNYEAVYTLSKKDTKRNELISIYLPIKDLYTISSKMLRLIDETLFFKANYNRFMNLSNREKEIITLLANGLQNNEIGDVLFISKATVEQHRKNLKRKLEIKRFVDLIRFAQAFDLI